MGYYVHNIFSIRTGGVFSGETDMEDLKKRVDEAAKESGTDYPMTKYSMSKELCGGKGSCVVIAGIFNYWTYQTSSKFAKKLSEIFQTEVIHTCHDEEIDSLNCQIWLAGKELSDVNESPIGRAVRRVS